MRIPLTARPLSSAQLWAVIIVAFGGVGATDGAVWGFVRGLHYLPTVPVAMLEGAAIFGVPSAGLGLVLGAVTAAMHAGSRRSNRLAR